YMCCASCGWAQLVSDYPKFDADTGTAVFYHNQDAGAFDEYGNLEVTHYYDAGVRKEHTHGLYLAWTGDGCLIVNALKSEGLTVEWDGDANKRIAVTGVEEGSL